MSRLFAWLSACAPWVVLLALSFLFRLPPLKNAADLNSDVAIVGIQARHILHGEWSPFLLGSTYQTSVDSTVAALFFAVLGPTPRALVLSALLGHVLLTWFVYDMLERHLGRARAMWLALLLVFTSAAIHSYALYPPRQASLTLIFAALWMLDRASSSKRPRLAFFTGGALASLACFADPYAFTLAPAAGLLGLLAAFDAPRGARTRRIAAAALGAWTFAAPLLALLTSRGSRHGEVTLDPGLVEHNAKLLVETCAPWALSIKIYRAEHMMDYAPWPASPGHVWFATTAAALFLAAILIGGAIGFTRRAPWEVRRLGIAGLVGAGVNLAGFLFSPMVMDHFSMRYLAATLLLAPLAIAPLAARLTVSRLVVWLMPYLTSSAVGGWVAYGPDVDGLSIRAPSAIEDARLVTRLREAGVHEAVADYWTAYRFTFLSEEDPVVVPAHAAQDRYPPYRRRVERATTFAYVVDPLRSEESRASVEARLAQAYGADSFTRIEEGRLTAYVVSAGAPKNTPKNEPENAPNDAPKAATENATKNASHSLLP